MDIGSVPLSERDDEQATWRSQRSLAHAPGLDGLPGFDVEFAVFTAPELERITGLPHHLQRLWRHRGHIEQRRRYAPSRYSSLDLAQLCVRYRLSTCSLPPAESREIGQEAGRIVLLAALALGTGTHEAFGSPATLRNVAPDFRLDPDLAARVCGVTWPEDRQYLWSADGSDFRFGPMRSEELSDGSYEVMTCIDLFEMGSRIARKAGRPLATLRFAGEAEPRPGVVPIPSKQS